MIVKRFIWWEKEWTVGYGAWQYINLAFQSVGITVNIAAIDRGAFINASLRISTVDYRLNISETSTQGSILNGISATFSSFAPYIALKKGSASVIT